MTAGRPTTYDPSHCETVVALGSEGKSRVEIAFELGVVKATIQNWEAAHPEFLAAMTRAKQAEQVWWEKKGRDNLTASIFQASMWSRSMAARFPNDWREKVAHVGGDKNDSPIQQEVSLTADAFTGRILGQAARARTKAGTGGNPGENPG